MFLPKNKVKKYKITKNFHIIHQDHNQNTNIQSNQNKIKINDGIDNKNKNSKIIKIIIENFKLT